MDALTVLFPVSGVKISVLVPPLVAMAVSTFTSMGGVSGAFLLLPFQMSVLGFTTPAVSATNFVYNIVAIPGGVYRYFREGRMAWPLSWIVVAGTLPGVFIGYYVRTRYLPDPGAFKLFAGCVLLYVGGKLFFESAAGKGAFRKQNSIDRKFEERQEYRKQGRLSSGLAGLPRDAVIRTVRFTLSSIEYEFWGERFRFNVPAMLSLALMVGLIGGIYGIGGGAIIAPFCVAVFRLPVHTVAGAALLGTFLTSVLGVLVYSFLPAADGVQTSPDWSLGALFGIGGFAGMYLGARVQKYVPQKIIKPMLGAMIVALALRYIIRFFL